MNQMTPMTAPFTSLEGQNDLPRLFASVHQLLGRVQAGTLDVSLPDGRTFRYEGGKPGPYAHVQVRNDQLFSRVIREGDNAFPEAYMDGWWDTPDLMALLDLLMLSNDEISRSIPGAAIFRTYERLRHWLRSNSKTQARKNISYHYDLGNTFYGLWLDDTMTYSSALFKDGQESLEQAQTNKYAALCDSLNLKPGDHVLEIGCGWGGFAEFAAKERGLRVTGLTISQEQHDFAVERMARLGLSDQVEIVMRDYRDEQGQYDGIASIEMFEAVGEKYWPVYFDTVHARLKPGARATLQIITIADDLFPVYRKTVDFVQKYIFPGGMLPSPSVLREHANRAGLSEVGSIEFGEGYSDTLRRWYETFNAKWDQIEPLGFDDRFRRMWNFYLTSCAATFHTGINDVTQITLTRP
jgi:cyclopropane-fatty-acyl-phospholipid synthase